MMKDCGIAVSLEVETDSSAAKGIASRRGVGRIRHLHTGLLWVQQRVQRGEIQVNKIRGDSNVADLGTKYLAAPKMNEYMIECGFTHLAGQSKLALKAQLGSIRGPRSAEIAAESEAATVAILALEAQEAVKSSLRQGEAIKPSLRRSQRLRSMHAFWPLGC